MVAGTAQATHVVSLAFRPYPVIAQNAQQHLDHSLNVGNHLQAFQKREQIRIGHFYYLRRIHFRFRLQWTHYLSSLTTKQPTLSNCYAGNYPNHDDCNTIHHWELNKGEPVKIILAEQKEDHETGLLYWDLQEAPIPVDNVIPLASITILARPENIYIPLGATVTNPSPHLLLPDIYVKPGINKIAEALYMLNLNLFFGTLSIQYKLDKKDMRSLMKL